MTPDILFAPPPPDLVLAPGEIQVFCASLDLPPPRIERLAETLSDEERGRLARFHFARDGNRFLAGRGLLREILGWLLRARSDQLSFSHGVHGKPRLSGPVDGNGLHFNLSHSDELVVYAVSCAHEVGIDLERIRSLQEADEIAARFFQEDERAQWQSLSGHQKTAAFFHSWTRQEALLKATGEGLGGPMEPGDGFTAGDPSDAPWSLRSLMPALGYVAAVAAKGRDVCLRCWQWPAEGLR